MRECYGDETVWTLLYHGGECIGLEPLASVSFKCKASTFRLPLPFAILPPVYFQPKAGVLVLLAGPAYNKMLQIVKADILSCILKLIRHNNEWVFFLKDTAM